jgi:hypothetical protein
VIRRIALILLLAACLAPAAAAHKRSVSYSSWRPDDGGARVHARVSQLDLSRIGLAFQGTDDAADPIAAYLLSRLALFAGDRPCRPTAAASRRETEPGWALYAWRVSCDATGPLRVESQLFYDVAPSHLHFARVDRAGAPGTERVLSEAAPSWTLPAADATGAEAATSSAGTSLAGYLWLGVAHILSGWDHLAFVLALLLLATTLGEVAALVTAFTLAHSVTLALATLGWVQPESGAVEALIGFSIALVAAENSWILSGRQRAIPVATVGGLLALALLPDGAVVRVALFGLALFSACHFGLLRRAERPARLRAAIAFAFGLVHGFGFAGILAALELPTARLVPALFGFNVGVELGQLAVVALIWPALRAIGKLGSGAAGRLVAEFASAAICGLGVYWFVVRQFG